MRRPVPAVLAALVPLALACTACGVGQTRLDRPAATSTSPVGTADDLPDDDTATSATPTTPTSTSPTSATPVPPPDFAALEARYHAVVGVYAFDTGTGAIVSSRANTGFAYASTYKALAAAALLQQRADLTEVVRYDEGELVDHSPVTAKHLAHGMRLGDVAAAAVEQSDNTAGNLLLRRLGGPAGLRRALAAVGDDVTNPVRTEPALNAGVPGDRRDTSTPRALVADLTAYLTGSALDAGQRATLLGWLRRSTTGAGLVRAGVPRGWAVGDKSGTAGYGARNDLAVVTPPGRPPILLAIMTRGHTKASSPSDALVAEVTRQALNGLQQ